MLGLQSRNVAGTRHKQLGQGTERAVPDLDNSGAEPRRRQYRWQYLEAVRPGIELRDRVRKMPTKRPAAISETVSCADMVATLGGGGCRPAAAKISPIRIPGPLS
jgi:hypothetical protein